MSVTCAALAQVAKVLLNFEFEIVLLENLVVVLLLHLLQSEEQGDLFRMDFLPEQSEHPCRPILLVHQLQKDALLEMQDVYWPIECFSELLRGRRRSEPR